MKGRLALALVAVALAALGTVAATAGAAHSSTLPKGFPYAAEIRATIHYDGTYKIHQTGYQRCSTADGETKVGIREEMTLQIDRTATFSHITVPVALPDELGKAVGRLGLEPTITTPGKISQDHSTVEINDSLMVPNPESEGCTTEPVVCSWELAAVPKSGIEELTAHELGDKLLSWSINVLGVNNENGGTCSISSGSDALTAALADSKKLYPKGLTNFPEVVISRALGNDFHQLLHHGTVVLNPVVNTPADGSEANCATHLSPEEESCTHAVSGTADVELRRLFLYRTKQAYPR